MKYVSVLTPGNDYWNVSIFLKSHVLVLTPLQYIPNIGLFFRTTQRAEYETLQATDLNSTFCVAEDQLHARLTNNIGLYQLIAPYFLNAATKENSGSQLGNGLTATGLSYNMLSSFCDDCPVSFVPIDHLRYITSCTSLLHRRQSISMTLGSTCRLINSRMELHLHKTSYPSFLSASYVCCSMVHPISFWLTLLSAFERYPYKVLEGF